MICKEVKKLVELKNTANYISSGIHLLFYGGTGVGKTSQIPTLENVVMVAAEKRLLSIVQAGIPYYELLDIDHLPEIYNQIKRSNFKNVVFDSLSEIAEMFLEKEKPKHKNQQQAYMKMQEYITGLVRGLRVNLPGKNIICIAKQEKIQDETGRLIYGPAFPGKNLCQLLPYMFDQIFCLRVENSEGIKKRVIQTGDDGIYIAKDSSWKLNDLEYDTLGNLIKKIGG